MLWVTFEAKLSMHSNGVVLSSLLLMCQGSFWKLDQSKERSFRVISSLESLDSSETKNIWEYCLWDLEVLFR